MNSELGLGTSLFMMTTKAMAWFFIFMTILNVPAMIFYYQGNDSINLTKQQSGLLQSNTTVATNETTSTADAQSQSVASVFAQLSLGNIG